MAAVTTAAQQDEFAQICTEYIMQRFDTTAPHHKIKLYIIYIMRLLQYPAPAYKAPNDTPPHHTHRTATYIYFVISKYYFLFIIFQINIIFLQFLSFFTILHAFITLASPQSHQTRDFPPFLATKAPCSPHIKTAPTRRFPGFFLLFNPPDDMSPRLYQHLPRRHAHRHQDSHNIFAHHIPKPANGRSVFHSTA